MHGAVVFLLDPCLSGFVEQLQRQGLLALKHGHQPTLDAAPERLLLGVLVLGIRQRRLVYDAEPGQTARDLLTEHGRTVVRHQRTRQAALHKRLAEPMHEALRGLVQIPLQVAHQARAVVDDAQQHRLDPDPGAGQHLARGVVEVQVP